MFYGGPAVRRKLTAYEIHAAIGPLKCCKVFDIFGSVRVPSRLKSSSSHHWPSSAPGDEFVIEALNFERAVLAPSWGSIRTRENNARNTVRIFDVAFHPFLFFSFFFIDTRESTFYFIRLYRWISLSLFFFLLKLNQIFFKSDNFSFLSNQVSTLSWNFFPFAWFRLLSDFYRHFELRSNKNLFQSSYIYLRIFKISRRRIKKSAT